MERGPAVEFTSVLLRIAILALLVKNAEPFAMVSDPVKVVTDLAKEAVSDLVKASVGEVKVLAGEVKVLAGEAEKVQDACWLDCQS